MSAAEPWLKGAAHHALAGPVARDISICPGYPNDRCIFRRMLATYLVTVGSKLAADVQP